MALILGTIGGVFFALGMCMALLPEWGLKTQGVVCGVIGLAICEAAQAGQGSQEKDVRHRFAL